MFSLLRRTAFSALLIAVVILPGGCAKKSDPADVVKKFFEQLAAGQPEQAYADSSFGFQAQQTDKAFAQAAREMGLLDQKAVTLETPEVGPQDAKVRAEVTTKDDRTQVFTVTLVQQGGAWRVHSLRSPKAVGTRTENRFSLVGKGSAFSDAQSQRMPEEREIKEMIVHTLEKFDQAIQTKSFQVFFDDVSQAWQKQLTVGQLERAFQSFTTAGVRIAGLSEAQMQLDGPPAINTEGVLVINGHFHTAPYQVYFSMKFVYELPHWKLFGLDVNLQR